MVSSWGVLVVVVYLAPMHLAYNFHGSLLWFVVTAPHTVSQILARLSNVPIQRVGRLSTTVRMIVKWGPQW